MQTCMEPNGLQSQFVFSSQNAGNGKTAVRNNIKKKGSANLKGKTKVEKEAGAPSRGKKQAKGSQMKEEAGTKKLRVNAGDTTNSVNSFLNFPAGSDLDQARQLE